MRDDLQAPSAQLALDGRWQLVQRVVSSQAFAGSQPLQNFLLYISEKTLRGLAGEIKEQTVGSEVLRRTADFDAGSDNIVRVRARQLRQKLTQYFESEGRSESVVITIPRGGYVPAFESRSSAPLTDIISGPAPVPETNPAAHLPALREGRSVPANWRWPAALGWVLAGIFAAAWVFMWLGSPRTSTRPALSPNSSRLWREVFGKGQTTIVVFSDPVFGIWQALKHKDLNLQEYLDLREVPEPGSSGPDLNRLLGNNTISRSAAHFLIGAIPLTEALEAALRVRSTRQVDVNDFKSGNAILFGSRRSNPWAELFEPRLHYAAMYPEGSRSFFKERITTGTAATFPTNGSAGTPPTDSYALIALLPNLANTGKVLFIEGLTMEGTDAASEFLLNSQSCDLLVQRVLSELGSLKPFEALLQLTPVSGGAANVRLIRLRAI